MTPSGQSQLAWGAGFGSSFCIEIEVGNHMGPTCPSCKKSDFSYGAILSFHPSPGEFTPERITCPSCGAELRVASRSRLIAGISFFLLLIPPLILLLHAGVLQEHWQIAVIIIGLFGIYYFALWPLVARLKPWSDWGYLPVNNKRFGSFTVVVISAILVMLLFYLANRYLVGG